MNRPLKWFKTFLKFKEKVDFFCCQINCRISDSNSTKKVLMKKISDKILMKFSNHKKDKNFLI